MKKVLFAVLAASLLVTAPLRSGAQAPAEPKVLRYAFRSDITSFDPAKVSDNYSNTLIAGLFDAPVRWAYLARPFKLEPSGCELPEISADYKTITFKVRPGLFFHDDPAFKGARRELVAADYVYSLKRHYDPQTKSPNLYILESAGVLGLSELRQKALKNKTPFEYDTPVEGLKALDKYTWQIKLAKPDPRFVNNLANPLAAALAREVVEAYGDRVGEHPVGTAAFMLKRDEWRRSSRIVLVKNPAYRDEFYKEEAPADRPDLQQLANRLKGRKLPMIDRLEVAIIEEPQPRWLAFMSEEADFIEEVPPEFISSAVPNGQLAPNLAKRHIQMNRYARADINFTFFNMTDPVVGGYEPAQVALRRAIGLAYDVDREIRLARKGQMTPAQGLMPPGTWGYRADLKTEMSEHNPAKAKALLDLHGYKDVDGDGWRERPDGSPLRLERATLPQADYRVLDELMEKALRAVGIRISFKQAKFPENIKASRAGKLQMFNLAWVATTPDAGYHLAIAYGPNGGQANHSRFDLPAFNRLYEAQAVLPNGPERQQLMDQANKLVVAYMPYKISGHRIWTDLSHRWVTGAERNIFRRDFWQYIDIDTAARSR